MNQDYDFIKNTFNELMITLTQASRVKIELGQKFREGEKQ